MRRRGRRGAERGLAGVVSGYPPSWSVGVVIPAQNEAAMISDCIHAARRSLAQASPVESWIVVVADRCQDDTAHRARLALGATGEVVEIEAGNVGRARAVGAERLLRRLGPTALDRTWLLTTDADTTAPASWAETHLSLADAGAAAVAGIVRVDSFAGHRSHVEPHHLDTYVLNPDGSHGHVHGANLGVRADAYRAVGGWAPLRTGEDHDLWDRLRSSEWPVVPSTLSWVTTSGRAVGRAPLGFAWRLGTYGSAPATTAPVSAP